LSPFKRKYPVERLALLVTGRVPQEPELLDLWKAAWDRLIWKALISKAKAIERELNRNQLAFRPGRSQFYFSLFKNNRKRASLRTTNT